MQNTQTIGQVVIVGGGPVGNFTAVLVSMLGVRCTVYEKRDSYKRQINLKIEQNFFSNVGKIMERISRNNTFFSHLNDLIKQKNGKILLKTLQQNLKQQAVKLGANYIIGIQIKTFKEVYDKHMHNFPIVLDCAGRRSSLREQQFGKDQKNMQIFNLHYALHINFKASVPKNFDFKLIYPVLKNSKNLKLGEIIVSKKKQKQQKFSHVTVPLFISDQLSQIIDKNYPNINREPLKPFSIRSENVNVVKEVQLVINSLFCALVMEDWQIDWRSVVLKKINITCGYSIRRSYDRYVSLGDSAAHFAYFKSLNFGLKHAFEFVKILSTYHSVLHNLGFFEQKNIVNRCWKKNPLLWPTKARQSPCPAIYFITNSQLNVLSPFKFNVIDDSVSRINLLPYINQQKINSVFDRQAEQMKQKSWQTYLDKFEQIRKADIDKQIFSNRSKKTGSQLISYFIWLNSLSPIKFSETASLMANGYYLDKKDFDYFNQTLTQIKQSAQNWQKFSKVLIQKIKSISKTNKKQISKQYEHFLQQLIKICEGDKFNAETFCQAVLNFEFQNKNSKKNKELFLSYKILNIIATVISQQTSVEAQQINLKQRLMQQ